MKKAIALSAIALSIVNTGVVRADGDDLSLMQTDTTNVQQNIQKSVQQRQQAQKTNMAEKEFSLAVPEDPPAAQPDNQGNFPTANKDAKKFSSKKGLVKGKEENKEKKVDEASSTLPFAGMDKEGDTQLAMPEITQRAVLSRSDINRIVCKEPIKDVFYSEEKGARIDFSGKNAFLKFQVKKNITGGFDYITMPIDLTIICGDATYTIIGFPKAVPSQTIQLDSGKKNRARENLSLTIFKDQPEKKKAEALIRLAYQDNLPTSFEVTLVDKEIIFFKEISVVLHKKVSVDGEGLLIKEFYIVPRVQGIELNEKEFLRKEFVTRPFALGIDNLKPEMGGRARLFVVETKVATREEDINVR